MKYTVGKMALPIDRFTDGEKLLSQYDYIQRKLPNGVLYGSMESFVHMYSNMMVRTLQ